MPTKCTSRSAPNTPIATPDRHLGDPSQALAVRRTERHHGRHRREERRGVTDQILGDEPRDPGGDGALGDLPALGAPPVETGSRARSGCGRGRPRTDSPTMPPILPPPTRRWSSGVETLSGLDAPARIGPMVHPLDPTAAGFLMAENRRMPMHVGGLQLFEKPEGAGRNFVRDLYTELIESDDIAPLFLKHPYRSVTHRRAVGLGRRRPVRHRVPRAPQRPAQAGPGPRAAGAVLAPALHPARDRAAAVGVAPDRGPARRPGRDVRQAPPRPGRRRLGDAAAPEHPVQRPRPTDMPAPWENRPSARAPASHASGPRPACPTCRCRRSRAPWRSAPRQPGCRER